MQPTRRTWTIAAIGVVLAVAAPVVASPIPVVGAAVVFGWLLAQQLVAVRQFQTTVDTTTLTITSAVSTTQVDTEFPVTVTVERPESAAETTQTVTLQLPVAAEHVPVADRQFTLSAGETYTTATILVSIPTAGRMTFPEPEWMLTDNSEMFTETVTRGPTPTVTIEAETMQSIHVGQGGAEASVFGQHSTDETGEGLTPAELREYLSGESVDKIDWKATARLPDTYVREFEAESDREISLIVDHRPHTGEADNEHTQLAYLREVALSILGPAETTGDAIGLITVGDNGLTTISDPTQKQADYTRIREQLLTLQPTPTGKPQSVTLADPTMTQYLSEELAGDESKFATTLRQFAESDPSYVERFESDSLYTAIEYLHTTSLNSQLTVILTTDDARTQLQHIVKNAATHNSTVLVFITPTVLFDTDGLGDLEAAYHRYRSFEQFRAELEQNNHVVAYEVGPSDRLANLLASQHPQGGSERSHIRGNT